MATGSTPIYSLPYPEQTDPVNVAGDIQQLAGRIEQVLPGLAAPNVKVVAYNTGASAISIGDPVQVTGIYSVAASATIAEVRLANAASSASATMPATAIAASTMGAGASGEVVFSGIVDAYLNTSAYAVGQPLYVAVGGGLTGTPPTYPDQVQKIAIVLESDASQGQIFMLSGAGISGPITWGMLKNGL